LEQILILAEVNNIEVNVWGKSYSPFGSAGRFNEWCHTISEQILILAEVNNIEDDSLENNKTKLIKFDRNFNITFKFKR
jgi:hypothetical protein